MVPGADIKIRGKGMTLVYKLLSPILDDDIEVDLLETSWSHDKTGAPVTRDQFMMVLVDVSIMFSLKMTLLHRQNVFNVTLIFYDVHFLSSHSPCINV